MNFWNTTYPLIRQDGHMQRYRVKLINTDLLCIGNYPPGRKYLFLLSEIRRRHS